MEELASDTAKGTEGRAGTVLRGKWVLGPVIGSGGTAVVYEGTHRSNGKRVAVKVLHRTLASDADTVARFRREGFVANLVNHRGTVAVFDDDTTDDGIPFLVMDRLDGDSLTRVLERASGGALEPARVLAIAEDVLDVLEAAHARGIIHRDVKPDNVFITRGGRAMLLDFGIARVEGDAARHDPSRTLPAGKRPETRAMTLDGSTLGTPKYMPPEQARGRWSEVDARSDLWALGATMFRALAGCGVRSAETTAELLMKAMTERAPPLADFAPRVAPEIAAIVDRALSLEKGDRWVDARAMQDAIREAASHAGDVHDETPETPSLTPTQSPSVPATRPQPSRSAPAWLAAGALAFVAFAAAIAWRPVARPGDAHAPPIESAGAAPATVAPPALEPSVASAAPPADSIPTIDLSTPTPALHHRHLRPRPTPTPTSTSTPSPGSLSASRPEPGVPPTPTGYAPPTKTEITISPSPLERRH